MLYRFSINKKKPKSWFKCLGEKTYRVKIAYKFFGNGGQARGRGIESLPSFKVIKVVEIKYKAIYRTTFFMVIYFMVRTGPLNRRLVKKYIRVF